MRSALDQIRSSDGHKVQRALHYLNIYTVHAELEYMQNKQSCC
jgi:hypothetical protein